MEDKQIILMVGPPGSGKSTIARQLNLEGYAYINQDSQGKQHLVFFESALDSVDRIVVDRMNFSKEQRARYLDKARAKGFKTKIIVLHEGYRECLNRCAARTDHETIRNETQARSALQTFFTKYERVEDTEADEVKRVWPETTTKDFAIWVDMDNTLSNASHREHHLQGEGKKNWKAFFDDMDKDPVNDWCKRIINAIAHYSEWSGIRPKTQVLICSARPDEYRRKTKEWLSKHEISYDHLIMRQRGDYRKDSIVKEIMYEFEIKTKFNLLFSIDDRKQVIDQIRKHGIIVLDCAGEKGHF